MPGVEPGSNLLRDLKLRQPRGLRLRLAAAVSLPTCKEFHTTPCPRGFGLGGGFFVSREQKNPCDHFMRDHKKVLSCQTFFDSCPKTATKTDCKFDTWGQIVPRSTLPPKA